MSHTRISQGWLLNRQKITEYNLVLDLQHSHSPQSRSNQSISLAEYLTWVWFCFVLGIQVRSLQCKHKRNKVWAQQSQQRKQMVLVPTRQKEEYLYCSMPKDGDYNKQQYIMNFKIAKLLKKHYK